MKKLVSGVGLCIALLTAGSAEAIVIDTFERIKDGGGDQQRGVVPPETVFNLPAAPFVLTQDGPIGGSRTLRIVEGDISTNLTVFGGTLGFSAGPRGSGIGEVVWDGGGAGLGGGFGEDLFVDNPGELFSIVIGFVDSGIAIGGQLLLSVTLTDVDQNTATVSEAISEADLQDPVDSVPVDPRDPDGRRQFPVVFLLNDFAGVDVQAVTSIVLRIDGPQASDLLAFESVTAGDPKFKQTAAPPTLALVGSGLAVFGVAVRRRSRSRGRAEPA